MLGLRQRLAAARNEEKTVSRGTWLSSTLSYDGLRVTLKNWTYHCQTEDKGELILLSDKIVEILVEHFQFDGYAVLDFSISRQTESVPVKRAGPQTL